MTNQEAIKRLKVLIDTLEGMISYCKDFEPKNDTSRYEQDIECYKLAIAALEKQISTGTRREYQHDYMLEWRYCPKCGNPVDSEDGDHYCSRCGQRLKFEEK